MVFNPHDPITTPNKTQDLHFHHVKGYPNPNTYITHMAKIWGVSLFTLSVSQPVDNKKSQN